MSFRRFDQCLYFLMVTLSTVGYGDMSPATQEGRLLLIGILIMILAVIPGFISEMNELSDGVDMSSDDRLFFTLAEIYDAVKATNTAENDARFEVHKRQLEQLRSENEKFRNESRKLLEALHLRLDHQWHPELERERHDVRSPLPIIGVQVTR